MSFKAIIAMMAAVLIAAGAGFGLKFWLDRNAAETASIVSVTQIKKIAQLATIEYHQSTFFTYKKKPAWYEWKKATLLLYLKGVVTGSVDLEASAITIPRDPRDKHITIAFKRNAIVISKPAIGPQDIQYITKANPNIFHKLSDADYTRAAAGAIEALRKAALDDGIEQKTADRAKQVLAGFLETLGYEATITFEGLDVK